MEETGSAEYSKPRATGQWPDCEVMNAKGSTVAFEVTEFVDHKALAHGTPDRMWSDDEIANRITGILKKKDQRGFGSQYAERLLLIHTDEKYLDATRVETLLTTKQFRLRHGNVTRAFFLFSYSPHLQRCPYIELRLTAAK